MTRILGVDPGTRTLGYGVIDGREDRRRGLTFSYVECGVVKVPPHETMSSRLYVLACTLREIIEEMRPDEVGLETAFAGRNVSSALKLGQARGAIMLLVAQLGLPLHEYAPAQIKQAVAGHGRATKQEIQLRVQCLLSLQREPVTDAADALAVALCHASHRLTTPRAETSGVGATFSGGSEIR